MVLDRNEEAIIMARANFLAVEPKTISENWVNVIVVDDCQHTAQLETLSEKITRLGNMDAGYKFRLSAILASDNNVGQVLTPEQ